ncbi:hypothetical protein [Blattabacterium cuenoti]|uniref:hypothetical protein n=1 Tax=Blattabacterium cuenoti TaxID=1653831 RepID=UPI00163BB6B3|nr:hypothetical protein [Blattabacterium cuenoti]
MNTTRFIISTIFSIMLGTFLASCHDEISFTEKNEKEQDPLSYYRPIPPVQMLDSQFPLSYSYLSDPPSNFNYYHEENDENDDLILEKKNFSNSDLKMIEEKIKKTEKTIGRLEKEGDFHEKEYVNMIIVHKRFLDKVKGRRKKMKTSPNGSEEQLKARKEYEIYKDMRVGRLDGLQSKKNLLSDIIKTIERAKNKRLNLLKIQEKIQKTISSTPPTPTPTTNPEQKKQ